MGLFKGLISDLLDDKAEKVLTDLPEDTKELLDKAGPFVTQFVSTFPDKVMEADRTGLGGKPSDLVGTDFDQGWGKIPLGGWNSWLKKPLEFFRANKVEVGKEFSVKIKEHDDHFGKMDIAKLLLLKILKDPEIFPMEDAIHFLDSKEAADKLLMDTKLAPGLAMPKSYHPGITELSSDNALTFIFFYGVGAPLMRDCQSDEEKENGAFVADLDVGDLAVREGFRKYGAKAYFDKNQDITSIFDCAKETLVKPGDDAWETTKCLLRQTMILVITGREHLLWCHLLSANEVTLACENELPPSHPVRRALNVFTFRTNYINDSASKTLLPYGSIFYRGTALTYDAMQGLMDASVTTSNILEPFGERAVSPGLQELSDDNKFPFVSDGVAYFNLVKTFIVEWFEEAGSEAVLDNHAKDFYCKIAKSTEKQAYKMPEEMTMDSLANVCAQHIFNATAWHELVGTVSTYTQFRDGAGLRLVDGATSTDLQSFLIGAIITSLTGVRTPELMAKFENLFSQDGAPEYERKVWDKFLAGLESRSLAVKEANKTRRFESWSFDPEQFECAVSV